MGTTEEEARTVYGDPDEFAGEMVKMINDKEFSDIRFIIGQERTTIYAHKSILATRCEVFRAMFADCALSDGSPLILADIKPIIFMAILEYIYTNCCSLSTLSVGLNNSYGVYVLWIICLSICSFTYIRIHTCTYVYLGMGGSRGSACGAQAPP
jgi:hypothetical protein